jgi:hypothetical protein
MAGAAALLVWAKAVVLVVAIHVNKGSAKAIEQLRAVRNNWLCKRLETWGRALKRVMILGLVASKDDYKECKDVILVQESRFSLIFHRFSLSHHQLN